ncbi:MAG: hypothetical protein ABH827_04890 [bacterium]
MQNLAACKVLYAHGLGRKTSEAQNYCDLIHEKIIGVCGPEWDGTDSSVKACLNSHLGQGRDVDAVVQEIKKNIEQDSSVEIVLVGFSKGATTMLNVFLRFLQEKSDYLKHIKAIILDSPFADPANVLFYKMGLFFPKNYDVKKSISIKDIALMSDNFDSDIVIVFMHLQKDIIVPINDSRQLYVELKELGFFNNLYLIEVPGGGHGYGCIHKSRDWLKERLFFIYAKHNLLLSPEVNKKGKQLMKQCSPENFLKNDVDWLENAQPSVEEVEKKIISCCF